MTWFLFIFQDEVQVPWESLALLFFHWIIRIFFLPLLLAEELVNIPFFIHILPIDCFTSISPLVGLPKHGVSNHGFFCFACHIFRTCVMYILSQPDFQPPDVQNSSFSSYLVSLALRLDEHEGLFYSPIVLSYIDLIIITRNTLSLQQPRSHT